MRANEFEAIERLSPREYSGGKRSLTPPVNTPTANKLPGGSRFLYSIDSTVHETTIRIWDPQGKDYLSNPQRQLPGQLIGKLSLHTSWVPIENALQVGAITVDEDYRGQGIAKALYGIVLTIMKRPLIAGESQTPGGRKNWVSISSIPGVEMKGWLSIHDSNLDDNIDLIMSKLGGQYIGTNDRFEDEYFSFDVQSNTTGKELEAYVKTKLSKVYGESEEYLTYDSGLYAVWSGR